MENKKCNYLANTFARHSSLRYKTVRCRRTNLCTNKENSQEIIRLTVFSFSSLQLGQGKPIGRLYEYNTLQKNAVKLRHELLQEILYGFLHILKSRLLWSFGISG